jgi:hypothetical protein
MESDKEKLARFRQRAKECRAYAAEMQDPIARAGMIQSAESYEMMATELAIKLDEPPPQSK